MGDIETSLNATTFPKVIKDNDIYNSNRSSFSHLLHCYLDNGNGGKLGSCIISGVSKLIFSYHSLIIALINRLIPNIVFYLLYLLVIFLVPNVGQVLKPFGQIPALEDGDLTVFESRAISSYIAEKYKNISTDLLRQGDLKEATLVKVWLEVESQRFEPVIRPITRELLVGPLFGKTPDQTIVDANVEKLGKLLDVYDERLGSTRYLAGDYYTLADLHHIPCIHYLMKTPYASLINSRPCVKAWWDDISSRPAVKKVSEKMVYAKY